MFNEMIREMKLKRNKDIIVSYFTFRQVIGWLGMLLPFICVGAGKLFSGLPMKQSISFYYHTNARDFFVGLLICVAMFLITYKGFRVIDKIISTIIGIAGLGIAIFPCFNNAEPEKLVGIFQLNPSISNKIHLGCAVIFFLLLSINSFFLFVLPEESHESLEGQDSRFDTKKNRNIIYRVCGIVIFLSLLLLGAISLIFDSEEIDKRKIILLFETIMLVAFGFSWLVKGKMIYFSLKLFSGGKNKILLLSRNLSQFSPGGRRDLKGPGPAGKFKGL